MVTRAPALKSIAIAVAFALSCIGLIIFVWVEFGGSVPLAPQGYRIHAEFNETGLLVPNADVRISGVNVGKVVSVQADGTHSKVTLDLQQQFAPIPADTLAILRQKTLLGEAYVELSTGNANGQKLPDGGGIPLAQVAPTQPLDAVLNSFTPPVQRDFQEFLNGTGAGLIGRGQDLNDANGNIGPLADELRQVADILNNQSGSLTSLISNSSTVLNTLGSESGALQSLITHGDQVFSATAAEDHALTATVNAMPAFLTQLKTTLVKLNGTLKVAKPSLDALKPVTPLLAPALIKLNALSKPVVALLQGATPVLRNTEADIPSVTAFAKTLTPFTTVALSAAQQIVPMINGASGYKNQITLAMSNLAAELQSEDTANTTSDALGVPVGMAHQLRQEITLGPDSVWGQTTRSTSIRSNAYPSADALTAIGSAAGEPAGSCTGAGTTGNVPCVVQPGYAWGNGIGTSYYPRLKKANP